MRSIGDKKLGVSNNMEVKALRLGVAVRQHQDDNVNKYRIPGLTTTKAGSLLAVYDVRRESGRDLQGHMILELVGLQIAEIPGNQCA